MADDWSQLTILLNRMNGRGDVQERVFEMVYAELRGIAQRLVRREAGADMYQATELLHETYLKKLRGLRVEIRNRQHFYALATRAMRQVLVEDARRRKADKRQLPAEAGHAWLEVAGAARHDPDRVLLLSPILDRLLEIDPRAASVLDLRFFLGCSLEETADVLGVTVRAVRDDWDFARIWLRKQLES
jgi:RNA polymerase sigma factor (TIGR02999 family)